MNVGKIKMKRVHMGNSVLDKDFTVISEMAMTRNYTFVPFEHDMDRDNVLSICKTPYPQKLNKYVYDFGHQIDIPLAVSLGLGVIKNLSDGALFLYNADTDDYLERSINEMVKLAVYHQIMNPDYIDQSIQSILKESDGDQYLKGLFLTNSDVPIRLLRQIYNYRKILHLYGT